MLRRTLAGNAARASSRKFFTDSTRDRSVGFAGDRSRAG
jgi:hypothetical protein